MFYPSQLLVPFAPRAGRMSRTPYILGFVAPFVLVVGMSWLMFFGAPGLLGTPGHYAIALGWTVLMTTGDAHNIRRWNDLGSSAALYRLLRPGIVLLPLLAFALQFLIPAHLAMAGDMEALAFMIGMEFGGVTLQPAPLALLAITLIAVTGNVVYLSLMPGQSGPNAYGPDPRGDPILPVGGHVAGKSSNADDDPVKRALVDYQARQAAAARPAASSLRSTGGATFGKKRS
jgi:uncharacterized membrane protein YhaH (DUF805 family)